jgi:uncharacterized membrane protein
MLYATSTVQSSPPMVVGQSDEVVAFGLNEPNTPASGRRRDDSNLSRNQTGSDVTPIAASEEAMILVSSLGFTPFVEIIGAVPTGIALHMGVIEAASWSVFGNNCLIIVLLLLLKPLEQSAWFRIWKQKVPIPQKAQHFLEHFGAPAVGILGPTIGMFLIIPVARGLGVPTLRVALAAMLGNALFALIYATVLFFGVNALKVIP